jgi:ornithine--oxo-acid transaminase
MKLIRRSGSAVDGMDVPDIDSLNMAQLHAHNEGSRYEAHVRHLNEQMVRVLRTIGFDVGFCRGEGQYLFDRGGIRYLDLLSGYGVFALGRNHPALRQALRSVIDADLPNLVQLDVSPLAGVLAQRLLALVPYLDKVFFANSGTEAVETAIKFARYATGRPGILYCEHAFHGLTNGSLSLNGDAVFRTGFEPSLPHCRAVPFNDLAALERALASRDIAAFIVEPIQGKGVNVPDDGYLREAAALCRRHGTLFVADEIQTGIGRTGRFLALEHWGVEADMVLLAKALSGGHVPVSAVLTRKRIYDKVFDRIDRAVVHGSTFAKNDLAMAAGIATLDVIKHESLVARAAQLGERLQNSLRELEGRYEFVQAVRGKGLMIGIEFGPPSSLRLKASWNLLETANKGLFCQLVTIPLFKDHKVLTQVAGHASHTIKLLPPLVITEEDCDLIEHAFDDVIAATQYSGAIWSLGRTLVGTAIRARG